MAELRPNPFDNYEPSSAYKFSDVELKFKDIELPCTRLSINQGWDNVVHAHVDIPGGYVETTGRKSYVVDADVSFVGTNWQERLENALWIHDVEGDVAGELSIPYGPTFDAKWTDAVVTWENKRGKILRCTFKEHSHNSTQYNISEDPAVLMYQHIPSSLSASLDSLVDDYKDTIDNTSEYSSAEILTMIATLDQTIYDASVTVLASDTSDSFDTYNQLISLRADIRRACPISLDLSVLDVYYV